MSVKVEMPGGAPSSEFNAAFVEGMVARMSMSYFKYGPMAQAYPHKVDAIATLEKCLQRYKETGNREWLMDVGNYAMIEYTHPRHASAHNKPLDSKESPGRKWIGEVDFTARSHRVERMHEEHE